MSDLGERVDELCAWAASRIRVCREQEDKFCRPPLADLRGDRLPQAAVEAWTERRALQVVLRMLGCEHLDPEPKGSGE